MAGRTLSWSQISVFQQCQQKYKLYYVDKVPRLPQGAFIGGRAVHKAIERSEKEGCYSDKERVTGFFHEELDAELAKIPPEAAVRWGGKKDRDGNPTEGPAWWRAAGAHMVRRYCTTREEDDERGMKLMADSVEMRVMGDVSNIQVQGYIDAFLFVDADGMVMLRDWKTSAYVPDGLQLALYARLIVQSHGFTAEQGEFVMLRRADAPRRRYGVDLRPFLPVIDTMVAEVNAEMDTGTFPMSPSNFCVSCAVKEACPYGAALTIGRKP